MYKAIVYFRIFQDTSMMNAGIRCNTEVVIDTVEEDGMEGLMKLLARVTSKEVTLKQFYDIYEMVEDTGKYDFGNGQDSINVRNVNYGEVYINSGLKIIKE